ncbi:hypothetical protein ABEF95_010452 [Exophiala dermatitidis]
MSGGILRYIEWGLAQLLYRARGHDAKLFTRSDVFKEIPQNIQVTSPELGPSGSHLTWDHSKLGSNRFPRLTWSLSTITPVTNTTNTHTSTTDTITNTTPVTTNTTNTNTTDQSGNEIISSNVQEYLLICEDPDSPLPTPGNHGIYYSIPAHKTEISPEDLELDTDKNEAAGDGSKWLKGGFRLGANHRGSVYIGPRPPVGHGEHRYFFQVVALKERLSTNEMRPVATREELLQQIKGKLIGWGVWIGIYENQW